MAAWLNQMDNGLEKFMYNSALDWKRKTYPDEVANVLVDASDHSVDAAAGKWISFLYFEREWNM
jgi:hypothetical protein